MIIPNIYWIVIAISVSLLLLSFTIYYLLIRKGKKDKFRDAQKLSNKSFIKIIGKNIAISDNENHKFKSGVVLASGQYKRFDKKKNILPFMKYGKSGNIVSYIKNKGHILIFGSTGSGKTDNLIKPSLIFNAKSIDEPSLLVFDPKGELYDSLNAWYKDNGYNVLLLNLDSPCSSHRWNPLQFPIDLGIRHIFIQTLFDFCKENKKKIDTRLEKELIKEQKELLSLADKLFDDLANLIITSTSGKEVSVWTNNAAEIIKISFGSVFNTSINECLRNNDINLINNIYIDSNEDIEIFFKNLNSNDNLIETFNQNFKKFNIPNIAEFINSTPQETFKKFVKATGENTGSAGIFNSTKDQWSSFLMNIGGGLKIFTSKELIDMISNSDFKFQDFITKKTIIFISTPTSGNNTKILASLFVEQLYAFLEKYAKKNGGSLKRTFYFFFEELANIPKMSSVSTILTLGRGYNIFAIIVVQSLPQIKNIYGNEALSIFWDNTMIKIYLYSQDKEVLNQISNLYGKKYVETDNNQNVQVDLFSQEEMSSIKIGKSLIMISRERAIYTNLASSNSIEKFHDFNIKKYFNIDKKSYLKNKKYYDEKLFLEQHDKSILNTEFTNNDKLDNFVDTTIKNSEDVINKKIISNFVSVFLLQEKHFSNFLEIFKSMENNTYYSEDEFYIKLSEELFSNIEFGGRSIFNKKPKKFTQKDLLKWILEERVECSTTSLKDILENNIDLFINEMRSNWILGNEFMEFTIPITEEEDESKLMIDLEKELFGFKKPNKNYDSEPIINNFKNDVVESKKEKPVIKNKKLEELKINDEFNNFVNDWISLMIYKDIWTNIKKNNVEFYKNDILSKLITKNFNILAPISKKKINNYSKEAYNLIIDYKSRNSDLKGISNNSDLMKFVWKDNMEIVDSKRKEIPYLIIKDVKKIIS